MLLKHNDLDLIYPRGIVLEPRRGQLLSHCCFLPTGSHNDVTLPVARTSDKRARAARVQLENRWLVMKKFTGKSSLSLLLGLAGLLSFVAPQARADEGKDPPTRVARISFVDGSVS